jgi:hypothetical protein
MDLIFVDEITEEAVSKVLAVMDASKLSAFEGRVRWYVMRPAVGQEPHFCHQDLSKH